MSLFGSFSLAACRANSLQRSSRGAEASLDIYVSKTFGEELVHYPPGDGQVICANSCQNSKNTNFTRW